jgi:beta-galactosidase/beta-glucuronidase
MRHSLIATTLVLVGALCPAAWKPVEGKIMTRWAADLSPENALPEYPRPMMVRADWMNLNGMWDYTIQARTAAAPANYQEQILVPFAVESALSGVGKKVGDANRLWYRRTFEIPAKWSNQRVLLHFGAVDWDTDVWVNGHYLGNHKGGYTPFSFEITGALYASGPQEIVVAVWDPTDRGTQPRGKQVFNPNGIWYTAVTGIWQTVWIEPVPKAAIANLKITPDVDNKIGRAHV